MIATATAPGWRLGILALTLALFWRVLHVNGALYEASGAPRLAALSGDAAMARPALAERDILRGILHDNPAEIAALLILAHDLERGSNVEQATRAYRLATRLAPLDREVLSAAAGFLLRHDRVPDALAFLARLVDQYPESRARAFPVLAEILASRRHAQAWTELAAGDPLWIRPFVLAACHQGIEPRVLAPLLPKRSAARGPAFVEADCLIDRLRIAGRWDEAYQVWLNTLPRDRLADVGFVFNGGFEFPASDMGFDWLTASGTPRQVGHAVDLAPASGVSGKRALRVSYNGKRQVGPAIRQYLALPAGRYELSGLARPESLKAGRGVHWALRCVEQGRPAGSIAHSERFVGSSEWRRFAVEVTIGAQCAGQILQLEAVGSGEGAAFVEGTVWFDELALRRRG